jgi:urease accessory protein
MKRLALPLLALVTLFALVPAVAFGHTGGSGTAGFSHGFMHPVTGLDHVLAMVMVGVLAWQLGGRALWLVPTTFVLVMAIGGVLGVAGIGLPLIEVGIALSVVVLGLIVAMGIRTPVAIAMSIAGLFAIFHGHAHGAEMPETAAGMIYGLGFMLGTALLHTAGIGFGFLIATMSERKGPVLVRTTGVVTALAGIGIVTGLI